MQMVNTNTAHTIQSWVKIFETVENIKTIDLITFLRLNWFLKTTHDCM